MQYIKVKDGQIIGAPQSLPINAENISNFYLLPPDVLKTFGWYEFENESVDISDNETIVRWDFEIQETKVVRKCIKRLLTDEEVFQKNSTLLSKRWEEIRLKRNQLLSESDWTQLVDAPVGNKNEWNYYRQELRDITNNPNIDTLVWPVKPLVIKPLPPPEITTSDNIQNEQPPLEEPPIEELTTNGEESMP
jgi:hypothetical protein